MGSRLRVPGPSQASRSGNKLSRRFCYRRELTSSRRACFNEGVGNPDATCQQLTALIRTPLHTTCGRRPCFVLLQNSAVLVAALLEMALKASRLHLYFDTLADLCHGLACAERSLDILWLRNRRLVWNICDLRMWVCSVLAAGFVSQIASGIRVCRVFAVLAELCFSGLLHPYLMPAQF